MMTVYPNYRVPRRVLWDLALAVLTGGQRSFRRHGTMMQRGLTPPVVVSGEANIPTQGPGVITVNHYSRLGFWAPWFSSMISAVTPQEICWVMTDAFTYPDRRAGGLYSDLSRLLLTRVARVYGFIGMPPMPPRSNEVLRRAAAVQRIIKTARANPRILLGLSPEGGDQPGGVLQLPPTGFGKLALALVRQGMPFYPVGAFEENGCFFLHFGQAYRLENDAKDRGEADIQARRRVMQAIAACLPHRLRGEWG